jgi:hypothetical protein
MAWRSTPAPCSAYGARSWDLGIEVGNGDLVGGRDDVGLDVAFAGFDGRIHIVGADRRDRWDFEYTSAGDVLTGGIAIADLSGDGRPEAIFATYSPQPAKSSLCILDAGGDGTLEIVVSLNPSALGVSRSRIARTAFPGRPGAQTT